MIRPETSSPKPSRIGFWIVLGMGALLLPLAFRMARMQAAQEKAARAIIGRHPSSVDDRTRADEIEKLQDEIELLKAQVRLKEVHRGATEKTLQEYRRRRTNYVDVNRRQPGAIQTDQLMEAQLAIVTHEGQLQISEAKLQESQIRLKQAERRLARLQRPAEKPDSGGRAQQEKRLRELEQQVENLLKEIRKMHKELQPDKPREPAPKHKEAQEFIDHVWPALDTARLEDNIPKAQKALQTCKDVVDSVSIKKLFKGAMGHLYRLDKELAKLHPELVIDDEIPAKKLKKVREQLGVLVEDIGGYLRYVEWPYDK